MIRATLLIALVLAATACADPAADDASERRERMAALAAAGGIITLADAPQPIGDDPAANGAVSVP